MFMAPAVYSEIYVEVTMFQGGGSYYYTMSYVVRYDRIDTVVRVTTLYRVHHTGTMH